MENFKHLLPLLDSGLIFRARRAQLGLTLLELQARSGIGIAVLRNLELMSIANLDCIRHLAPELKLTEEQAIAMLAVQRQETVTRLQRPMGLPSRDDAAGGES